MKPVRPAVGADDSRDEHAVLAAMLEDSTLVRLGANLLKRAWFVDGRHGDVFAAILTVHEEGLTADAVEVARRMPADMLPWFTGLQEGADARGFEVRCKRIAKAAAERRALGKLALVDAASPPDQRAEALRQAQNAIARVNSSDGDRVIVWPVATIKNGVQVPSPKHIENTATLLTAYGVTVAHNLMRHRLEITVPSLDVDEETRENKTIEALVALAERNGLARPQTLSHIQILARSYHPVWEWIVDKPWDGVNRMPDLLASISLMPGTDADLAGLLLHRWLIGCVKAVMPRLPGDSFRPQGVLTLQGGQGLGKSRWLEALAPQGSGWVLPGSTLDPHDRDSVSQLTSVWIVELGELDGTLDRAHIAAVKAFVDRPADTYRRPYARSDETIPRRTMMAASVNPRSFLADETGSRRWWCLSVCAVDADHGIDMQQLWAQVRTFVDAGERWWLDRDEQARLSAANMRHTMADPLIEDLWRHFEPALVGMPALTVGEIWTVIREGRRTWTDARKIAQALEPYRTGKLSHGSETFLICKRGEAAAAQSWIHT